MFWDLRLPEVSAAERAALYVAAVETLAKLHSLNLASLDLEGYGKGLDYCKRQVRCTFCRYFGMKREKIHIYTSGFHLDQAVQRFSSQRHSRHERAVELADRQLACY